MTNLYWEYIQHPEYSSLHLNYLAWWFPILQSNYCIKMKLLNKSRRSFVQEIMFCPQNKLSWRMTFKVGLALSLHKFWRKLDWTEHSAIKLVNFNRLHNRIFPGLIGFVLFLILHILTNFARYWIWKKLNGIWWQDGLQSFCNFSTKCCQYFWKIHTTNFTKKRWNDVDCIIEYYPYESNLVSSC